MKYKSFRLQNFKGIEDITIEMSENNLPKTLVGLNESGKTTILEGIRLIGYHCENINKRSILSNGKLQAILPKIPLVTKNIILTCVIKDRKYEDKIDFVYKIVNAQLESYSLMLNDEKVDWVDSDGDDSDGQYREDYLEKLRIIKSEIPNILYYDDFIFEIPEKIKFQTTKSSAEKKDIKLFIGNNKEWGDVLKDVLKSSNITDNPSFQQNVVDFLDNNPEGKNSFKQTISALSKHINKIITKNWIGILKSNAALKEIELEVDIENGIVSFVINVKTKQDRVFLLSERSKGCRWFFSFMLFTEFRKHRSPNTIFLLDEPASNMHASIQEKIVKSIKRLSKDAHVIYTTHSPYMVDMGNIEETYIVENLNSDSEVKDPNIIITKLIDDTTDKDFNDSVRPLVNNLQFNLPSIAKYNVDNASNNDLLIEQEVKSKFRNIGENGLKVVKKLAYKTFESNTVRAITDIAEDIIK